MASHISQIQPSNICFSLSSPDLSLWPLRSNVFFWEALSARSSSEPIAFRCLSDVGNTITARTERKPKKQVLAVVEPEISLWSPLVFQTVRVRYCCSLSSWRWKWAELYSPEREWAAGFNYQTFPHISPTEIQAADETNSWSKSPRMIYGHWYSQWFMMMPESFVL